MIKLTGRRRAALRYVYFIVLFSLIGAALHSTWSDLRASGWSPNYGRLAVSLLLVSLAVLSLAFWWVFSLLFLGERIQPITGVKIWVLSQLAKYLPGGIWNYASRVYSCSQIGISKRNAVLSLGLETILRIQAAVIVFLLSVPFWPVGKQSSTVTILSMVGVLAVGFLSLHPRVIEWVMNLGLRALRKQSMHIPSLGYALTLKLLLGHVLTVVGVGGAFYLMVTSVCRVSIGMLIPFTGILSISVISGFLNPLTPHGLGTREGLLIVLLSYYLPLPVATMVSLLSRLWLTASELVGVVLVLSASWLVTRKSGSRRSTTL